MNTYNGCIQMVDEDFNCCINNFQKLKPLLINNRSKIFSGINIPNKLLCLKDTILLLNSKIEEYINIILSTSECVLTKDENTYIKKYQEFIDFEKKYQLLFTYLMIYDLLPNSS